MALLKRTFALATALSLLAVPAFAGHNAHYAYGNQGYGNAYGYRRPITLAFESIHAKEERGTLTVSYRVQPNSFWQAQRVGVVPKMVIEGNGLVFETRLDRAEGTFAFELPRTYREDGGRDDRGNRDRDRDRRDGWHDDRDFRRDELKEITVSLKGKSHKYTLAGLTLNGRYTERLVVAVESVRRPGNGHHGPRFSMQPAVIQACGYAMDGAWNEKQCLNTADTFRFDPVQTIMACETSFDGDANELACIQTAARSNVARLPALEACELAMDGDANELACFAKTANTTFAAAPVINACEASFDGDYNELACMDQAFRFSYNPVPVIQSCDAAMNGDSAELACLARY